MNEKQKSVTYAASGVNIDTADQFVENISELASKTTRPETNKTLGAFGAFFDLAKSDYHDPIIVTTTDGVGTKLKIAHWVDHHETIGIDLVAMNVNDLIVHGAEPMMFLDYFATGKLHLNQAQSIIKGIVQGCKQSNCSLSGGETAEMPGMYNFGEYDLAGFAMGLVERDHMLPKLNEIEAGDIVLGLASSGLHSNGFSLVRFLIEQHNIDIFDKPPFKSEKQYLYEELLIPTKIYVRSLLPLIKTNSIKALAHITGGGLLENIPRVLPESLMVELDAHNWQTPPIFKWIAQTGNVSSHEIAKTFNCGVGMIVIVKKTAAQKLKNILSQFETVYEIGIVKQRNHNQESVVICNSENLIR